MHGGGYNFIKSQEKISYLMYMDDMKLFSKNEKELETLIQTVRIYSLYLGIKFIIEKCAMFITKSGKRQITEGIELQSQEKVEMIKKMKLTSTMEFWTPSNQVERGKIKRRGENQNKKSISEKGENILKPSSTTGISSTG